jgi:hypothetical protein
MIELRYNTAQTIVLGPFLEQQSRGYPINPYGSLQISWCYWRYLIKADGSVVDLGTRNWSGVPSCTGLYFIELLASDVDVLGATKIYVHDSSFIGKPVYVNSVVVKQNYYDSKYGDDNLRVFADIARVS